MHIRTISWLRHRRFRRAFALAPLVLAGVPLGAPASGVASPGQTPAIAPSPAPPRGTATQSPLPRGYMPNRLTATEAMRVLQSDDDPFWTGARAETAPLHASGKLVPNRNRSASMVPWESSRALVHGNRRRKRIAITFDDGPHPWATPELLAILSRERVPATFFVVGEMAERYPELVRAEAAAHMEIGNHTFHHVSLPQIPDSFVLDEIKACGDVIRSITGKSPRWFRPPGGRFTDSIEDASARLGYTMALWTDDPGDYKSVPDDVLLRRTLDKATPGGILLLHDGPAVTKRILPDLIHALKKQGYTIVSLDDLRAK